MYGNKTLRLGNNIFNYFVTLAKSILEICKWPRHLTVLSLVNSGITINKVAKMLIALIS